MSFFFKYVSCEAIHSHNRMLGGRFPVNITQSEEKGALPVYPHSRGSRWGSTGNCLSQCGESEASHPFHRRGESMSPCTPNPVRRTPRGTLIQSEGAPRRGDTSFSTVGPQAADAHSTNLSRRIETWREMPQQRGEWSPSSLPCVTTVCPCDASGHAEGGWAPTFSPRSRVCLRRAQCREPSWSQTSQIGNYAVETAPLPCRALQRAHVGTVPPGAGLFLQEGIRGQGSVPLTTSDGHQTQLSHYQMRRAPSSFCTLLPK